MNFDSSKETIISIVAYNAVDSIKSCLKSLNWTKSRNDVQVIVFDNSVNSKIELLCSSQSFEYYKTGQNLGFGKGHNKIYSLTKEKYNHRFTLLLNPDTEITESDYDSMMEVIKQNEETAIVAPKLRNLDGTQELSVFTDPSGLEYLLDFSKQLFNQNMDFTSSLGLIAPQESAFVKGATGACMLIENSEVISQMGLFDPDFFMYFEDLDLCRRVRKNKYKIYFCNEISVLHHRGKSSDEFDNKKQWSLEMMYKSLSIYFRKNKSRLDQTVLKFSLLTALHLRVALKKNPRWAKRMIKELNSI